MTRYFKLLLLMCAVAGSCPAQSDVNIDSAISLQTLEVKRLVLNGENDAIGHGLDMSGLLKMAEDIRANYPAHMSLTEIAHIGDTLTATLRDGGYKFHYVFLPHQNARTGVVRLDLIEVKLDGVSLLGDFDKEQNAVLDAFATLIDKPVFQPDIDTVLRSLKEQSELSIFAYYSRGAKPNSVRLNLRAQKLPRHFLSASVDNFGSESSGHNRLTSNYSWLSPLGHFDRLDVGLMYAQGGASNVYGTLAYSHPFTSIDNQVSVQISNNQYDVGEEFSVLELKGSALITSIGFSQIWRPSDLQNHRLALTWNNKSVDYSNVFNDDSLISDEVTEMARAAWYWQLTNQSASLQQKTEVNINQGQHELTGALTYREAFTYYQVNSGSYWNVDRQQLNLNVNLQFTDKILPSFEKLSLTGINGARGFYAGQFAVDRGLRATLTWRSPPFWHRDNAAVAGFVFADFGTGEKLGFAGETLDQATLASAGLGVSAQIPGNVFARLQWSAWNRAEIDNSLEPTELPLVFDLQYRW